MATITWSLASLNIDLVDGSALTGLSRALCITALSEMLDRYAWEEMSDAQWDTTEAAVSAAIYEVMSDDT